MSKEKEKKAKEQEHKENNTSQKEEKNSPSPDQPEEKRTEEFNWESEEGQAILRAERKGKKKEETEEVPAKREEISLEEAVAEERVARQQDPSRDLAESKYVLQLSEKPIRSIQEEMGNIYRIVEDRGYITTDEERRVEYLSSAVERKLDAIDEGKYSLTEDVARAALLTQSISDSLKNTYRRNKKENEWYRSG